MGARSTERPRHCGAREGRWPRLTPAESGAGEEEGARVMVTRRTTMKRGRKGERDQCLSQGVGYGIVVVGDRAGEGNLSRRWRVEAAPEGTCGRC